MCQNNTCTTVSTEFAKTFFFDNIKQYFENINNDQTLYLQTLKGISLALLQGSGRSYQWNTYTSHEENEGSEFDRYLISNDIPDPCGCVKNEVEECYKDFYATEHLESYFIDKKEHRGIENIIEKYFKMKELTCEGIITLCDILIMIKNKGDDNYPCGYMETRFNITDKETHCVLAYLDQMDYVDHGSALRCPWLSEKGKNFLTSHLDVIDSIEPLVLKRLKTKEYDNYLPNLWIMHDLINESSNVLHNSLQCIQNNFDIEKFSKTNFLENLMQQKQCEILILLVNEKEIDENVTTDFNDKNVIWKIIKNENDDFVTIEHTNGSTKKVYVSNDKKNLNLQCIV